jgi:hypothetical protein
VISIQPDVSQIPKIDVICNFTGGQVAVIIDNWKIFGNLMIELSSMIVFQKQVFVNEGFQWFAF